MSDPTPAAGGASAPAAEPSTTATSPSPAAKAAPVAKAATTGPDAPGLAAPEGRGRRKVREGIVISNSMDKTAVVAVVERVRHARYAKTVQRTKRFYAHDESNDVRVGDRVRLVETRPLSKLKRWRVEQVLERAR